MPWLPDAGAVLVPWYAESSTATPSPTCYGDAEPGDGCPRPSLRSEQQVVRPGRLPRCRRPGNLRRGSAVGYRGYDARGVRPLFPFGFGLGYIDVCVPRLPVRRAGRRGRRRQPSRVHNTGRWPGVAVPQVYGPVPLIRPVSRRAASEGRDGPARARREPAGDDPPRPTLVRALGPRLADRPGSYGIAVGRSSRDLPLHRPRPDGCLRRSSELQAVQHHRVVRRARTGGDGAGPLAVPHVRVDLDPVAGEEAGARRPPAGAPLHAPVAGEVVTGAHQLGAAVEVLVDPRELQRSSWLTGRSPRRSRPPPHVAPGPLLEAVAAAPRWRSRRPPVARARPRSARRVDPRLEVEGEGAPHARHRGGRTTTLSRSCRLIGPLGRGSAAASAGGSGRGRRRRPTGWPREPGPPVAVAEVLPASSHRSRRAARSPRGAGAEPPGGTCAPPVGRSGGRSAIAEATTAAAFCGPS